MISSAVTKVFCVVARWFTKEPHHIMILFGVQVDARLGDFFHLFYRPPGEKRKRDHFVQ